ncbi:hypothetical protein DIPPA_23119 [Diplonema papillatum]|nr:hypothetical protein DIPPA_23119 [Diplonema papillatum]
MPRNQEKEYAKIFTGSLGIMDTYLVDPRRVRSCIARQRAPGLRSLSDADVAERLRNQWLVSTFQPGAAPYAPAGRAELEESEESEESEDSEGSGGAIEDLYVTSHHRSFRGS